MTARDLEPPRGADVIPARPPRILVIRLTALGDVVLVEPILRALADRFPGALVDLVTEAHLAPLFAEALRVNAVVGWDRRGADRGVRGIGRVLARLPGAHYDLVLDLQGKLRTRLLAARVSADRKLRLTKRTPLAALGALFGFDPPIHDRHATEVYLGALTPLGIEASKLDLAPRLGPLGARREGRPVSVGRRVGLSPGATHATKRWPPERFGELADRIHALDPSTRFVLIGGPQDRPLLESARAHAQHAQFEALDVASLGVLELARVLAELDLLISVDTGPAHLAAALSVPVVVLFGPTSTVRWGPRGVSHRVVSLELDCAPCSNTGGPVCPRPDRNHACLVELDVDRVFDAVRPLVARGKGA